MTANFEQQWMRLTGSTYPPPALGHLDTLAVDISSGTLRETCWTTALSVIRFPQLVTNRYRRIAGDRSHEHHVAAAGELDRVTTAVETVNQMCTAAAHTGRHLAAHQLDLHIDIVTSHLRLEPGVQRGELLNVIADVYLHNAIGDAYRAGGVDTIAGVVTSHARDGGIRIDSNRIEAAIDDIVERNKATLRETFHAWIVDDVDDFWDHNGRFERWFPTWPTLDMATSRELGIDDIAGNENLTSYMVCAPATTVAKAQHALGLKFVDIGPLEDPHFLDVFDRLDDIDGLTNAERPYMAYRLCHPTS